MDKNIQSKIEKLKDYIIYLNSNIELKDNNFLYKKIDYIIKEDDYDVKLDPQDKITEIFPCVSIVYKFEIEKGISDYSQWARGDSGTLVIEKSDISKDDFILIDKFSNMIKNTIDDSVQVLYKRKEILKTIKK